MNGRKRASRVRYCVLKLVVSLKVVELKMKVVVGRNKPPF